MWKKIRDSLTAKIFLLTVLLLMAVSVGTYASVAHFLPVTYRNELEENLQRVSEELQKELEQYQSLDEAENLLELFAANNQASVTLLAEDGTVVFPVQETAAEAFELDQEDVVEESLIQSREDRDLIVTEDIAFSGSGEDGTPQMITSVLLQDGEWSGDSAVKSYRIKIGREAYTLLVSGTMQAVDQTMRMLREILPAILGIVFVSAILCAVMTSLCLTRPIIKLAQISRELAGLRFSRRCREKRTDEIGVLAGSLNTLSDNLAAALEELQRANRELKSEMEREREEERRRTAFFAAASHELKTPVTVLKGHLGGMLGNVGAYRDRELYLERSYEVTETMEGMVQEILAVSRMESGAWEVKKEKTDLAELIRLQVAELIELVEKKGMQLLMDVPEHLNWLADASMMTKVFRNLLINAVRYSPQGAFIRIHLCRQGNQALFYIENTGAQIPDEALPHLFEAFYRVDPSRNRKSGGSGLGLYIVRMILDGHGGVYGAENSREGVRIWFRLGSD